MCSFGCSLQLPVDELVLLVTLLAMAIVCLSVWWGVMRPPAIVLNACSRIASCLTPSRSKDQPDADAKVANNSAAAAAELPSIEDKLAKQPSSPTKRPGSPSKVDSAADLHNTSLRCMAVSAAAAGVTWLSSKINYLVGHTVHGRSKACSACRRAMIAAIAVVQTSCRPCPVFLSKQMLHSMPSCQGTCTNSLLL